MRRVRSAYFGIAICLIVLMWIGIPFVNAETWTFDTEYDGWIPGGTYDNPRSPFPQWFPSSGDTPAYGVIVLDSCSWWGYDEISKTIGFPNSPSEIKIHIVKTSESQFHDGEFQLRIGGKVIGEQYVPAGYDDTVVYQIPNEFLGKSDVLVELISISNGCNGEHIGIDQVEITSDNCDQLITTGFDQKKYGFRFSSDHKDFLHDKGHCFGMVWAAMDYYYLGYDVPQNECNLIDSFNAFPPITCETRLRLEFYQCQDFLDAAENLKMKIAAATLETQSAYNLIQLVALENDLKLHPVALGLSDGDGANHLVVAYKLEKNCGSNDILVYVYNPFYPQRYDEVIQFHKNSWGYDFIYHGYVVCHEFTRPMQIFKGIMFDLHCPVDITVTDPDGHIINKQVNEITGASYTELDLDGDNDPDAVVFIPDKIPGKYHITVIPKSGASFTDTFTIGVVAESDTKTIANNVAIRDIPTQPYEIEVTTDGQIIVTGAGGTPVPEFPSIFLPATMIIGFLGAVLLIQRTKEH